MGTVSIHSGGVLPRRFVKKSLVEWALEKENPSRVARVLKKKPCDALIPVCLSNDKRLALKRLILVKTAKNVLYSKKTGLSLILIPICLVIASA